MTTKSILQPLDVNSTSMDKSPACKRARYESPIKERWSLVQSSNITFEDLQGVALLDSSDSDSSEDDYRCKPDHYGSTNERIMPDNAKENRNKTANNGNIKEANKFLYKNGPEKVVTQQNYFNMISDEVMLHILHFLPKRLLTTVALVCKRWHQLSQDESLWARMDLANRQLQVGAIGHILARQVLVLRLTQAEISHPPILSDSFAYNKDFRARLMYLDLGMAYIAPESLIEIFKRCDRLKKVSLETIILNADVLESLANSEDLEVLNLAMAQGIDEAGLKNLLRKCKKIRELNIAWTYLNEHSLRYLCSNLPLVLDRLNLSGCRKTLTNDNIAKLVSRCPKLRELDLSDCTGLTGDSISYILTLKELNFLALSRCYQISHRMIANLKHIKSLSFLDIHGGYIDNAELQYIQENLGAKVQINKFKFSSVARPTVGTRRSSIWNMRVRD